MTRLMAIFLATVMLASTAAWGDEVKVKGIAYSNAKVTGVKDGEVQFQLSNNPNGLSKSLSLVDRIQITGQESFNQAEESLAKGKAADAVNSYDLAFERATDDWLKNLIALRRLRAMNEAGIIDRAVKEWCSLMDQTDGSQLALSLRPTKLTDKGSQENGRAISTLEGKLADEKRPQYAAAVRALLLALYQKEGNVDKARALSSVEEKASAASSEKTPKAQEDAPQVSRAQASRQLQAAVGQLQANQPEKALADVEENLKSFSPGDLPQALLLAAKAQMMLKDRAQGEKRTQLLLAAGLNCMRVATFYPTTPEAGEAMLLAGTVNVELGNAQAARSAFELVIRNFGDTDLGAKARAEMQKLKTN